MSPTGLKVGAAVLFVVGLFASGVWVGSKLERTAWLERDLETATESSEMLRIAAEDAREAEREQAEALLAAVSEYHEGLEADLHEAHRIIASAVSGSIRLSVPARRPPCPDADPRGRAGAEGDPGPARAELHPEAARFLVGEASRADAVVRRYNLAIEALAACEALVPRKPTSHPISSVAAAP